MPRFNQRIQTWRFSAAFASRAFFTTRQRRTQLNAVLGLVFRHTRSSSRALWLTTFNALNGHLALASCLCTSTQRLPFLHGRSIVVISFSRRIRQHQVMQKAFIKETYYCTILNRAPAKLAPARMAQLSTRGSRDPGETGLEMWLNMKVLSPGLASVISHTDKLMVRPQSNCLDMENRDKHAARLREAQVFASKKTEHARTWIKDKSSTTQINSHYFVLHYTF